MISIIVAMDENRGIGFKGELLTFLPGDLPRFKKITTNHSVIMGRKTYDSLPNGPLKDRKNIVISRDKNLDIPGVIVVHSLQEAILLCPIDDESFIIGGGEIYKEAIKYSEKLYITHIHKVFKADTYFPEIDQSWEIIDNENKNENEDLQFSYTLYSKKTNFIKDLI